MAKKTRKVRLLSFFVLLLAVCITAVLLYFKPKPEVDEPEALVLAVTVVPVEQSHVEWKTHLQGEVRAKTSINLVSEVTGKVVEISPAFTEGGMFLSGDMLLLIDEADYLVAVESAKAQVAAARVNLDIEIANSEIRKKQWKASGSSLDKASPLQLNYPQVAQAKANLRAAQSELSRAQLDLERTRISVPFNGRVKEKFVGVGQFVIRGESLASVFSTDSVEVRVAMTDKQLSELQLTLGKQLRADAENKSDRVIVQKVFGNRIYTWEGSLDGVDAIVDPKTRLIYATVRVENPYLNTQNDFLPLAPGFFVDVEIEAAKSVEGWSVPRNALRRGDLIYLYSEGKLQIKHVDVLQTSSEVAILAPWNGEKIAKHAFVITSPVPGAYEGMAIKLNENASNIGEDAEALDESAADREDAKKTESSL